MKKLFLSFGIVAMALTSCSPPDPEPDPSVVLLKKTITHNADGSSTTADYTYNGSKLTTVTSSDGGIRNYTYTGDLITNMQYYEGADLNQEDIFTYNSSGQLVEFVKLIYYDNTGIREVYVYGGDGSITMTNFSGDLNSQPYDGGTRIINFLANGEINSITNPNSSVFNTYYTYDDMNCPLKNVTGRRKISFTLSRANGFDHNITSETIGSVTSPQTYTYNAAGYPVTSSKVSYGETITTEYFYE